MTRFAYASFLAKALGGPNPFEARPQCMLEDPPVSQVNLSQPFSPLERRLTYVEGEKIESARVYGDLDQYAYYFIDIMVGTPPQRVSVIADTGSTIGAFPCSTCQTCGQHLDKTFNAEKSSTAEWIMCGDTACQAHKCRDGHCSYEQSYREGSGIKGWLFEDMVSLGDQDDRNPPIKATLGCHTEETKLFKSQRANGILGMAPHKVGRGKTLLENLFASPQVSKEIFSFCLSPNGGELTIGGFNSTRHVSEIKWTGLEVKNYYGVKLDSVTVAGLDIRKSFGSSTIIDSGTTYVYVPPGMYHAFLEKINSACSNGKCGGATKISNTCWSSAEGFPEIVWRFSGSVHVKWPGKNGYMFFKSSTRNWCYAFDNAEAEETVLGAAFMLNIQVVFDLKNKLLGLAEAVCPIVLERPSFEKPETTGDLKTSEEEKTDQSQSPGLAPHEETVSTGLIRFVLFILTVGALGIFVAVKRRQNFSREERASLTTNVIGLPFDEEAGWPPIYEIRTST